MHPLASTRRLCDVMPCDTRYLFHAAVSEKMWHGVAVVVVDEALKPLDEALFMKPFITSLRLFPPLHSFLLSLSNGNKKRHYLLASLIRVCQQLIDPSSQLIVHCKVNWALQLLILSCMNKRLFQFILSLLQHATLYLATPHHTTPRHTTSRHTTHTTSRHTTPHPATTHHTQAGDNRRHSGGGKGLRASQVRLGLRTQRDREEH